MQTPARPTGVRKIRKSKMEKYVHKILFAGEEIHGRVRLHADTRCHQRCLSRLTKQFVAPGGGRKRQLPTRGPCHQSCLLISAR